MRALTVESFESTPSEVFGWVSFPAPHEATYAEIALPEDQFDRLQAGKHRLPPRRRDPLAAGTTLFSLDALQLTDGTASSWSAQPFGVGSFFSNSPPT